MTAQSITRVNTQKADTVILAEWLIKYPSDNVLSPAKVTQGNNVFSA